MSKYALISDVHGCYHTLMSLVDKIPLDHEVILLGDLVDRGPYSKEVVEWVVKNNIRCVQGNHDHMMADFALTGEIIESTYSDDAWFNNGALHTIRSYGIQTSRYGEVVQMLKDNKTFQKHARFLYGLPTCIEEGRLHLSHTGHGALKEDDDNPKFSQVWARGYAFPADGKFRVLGHTPNKQPLITANYANIDTGAAYASAGFGRLTCMLWPSKEVIQMPTNEPSRPEDKEL